MERQLGNSPELPNRVIEELARFRGKPVAPAEEALLRKHLFSLAGPESIGLAFYLVDRQDSRDPNVGQTGEEVQAYFTRWLSDAGFVLAQIWHNHGDQNFVLPYRTLGSAVHLFREGKPTLTPDRRNILSKKFAGVYMADPFYMDMGSDGNLVRDVRANYFSMMGENVTPERERWLIDRMRRIETVMTGRRSQEVEAAKVDFFAKMKTLREVFFDLAGPALKDRGSVHSAVDKTWWEMVEKSADALTLEAVNWEERVAKRDVIRERDNREEEALSDLRRAVEARRAEQLQRV
jgi:hypothetical protein